MGHGPSRLPVRVCAGVQQIRVDEVLADEALLKRTTQNATALYKAYRFTPKAVRTPGHDEDMPSKCFVGGVRFWHLGAEVDPKDAEVCYEGGNELQGDILLRADASEEEVYWRAIVNENNKLIIEFKEATPATEFAFKTHSEPREFDPVEFMLEGSNDKEKWHVLCKTSDYAVPNARSEWTSRVALLDPTIAEECSGKKAAEKLDEATRKTGATDMHNWLAGKPPRAPTEELAALMQCCKAQLVGEPQMRRQILFSMLHATCETMTESINAEEAKKKKSLTRSKGKDMKGARANAISSLSAKCATRMILEPLLSGGPTGPLLEMLNEQLTSGMMGIDLPPDEEDLPGPLRAAIEAACDLCREALQKGPEGARAAAGSPAAGVKLLRDLQTQGPKIAELLLRLAALRGSLGDVLAVASWLLSNPGGELSDNDSLLRAVRDLYEIRAPWAPEVFQDGKWLAPFDAKKPTAIRSKLELTSAQVGELETRGAFVEIQLLEGASGCRVCLLPAGSEDTEQGVGVQSGQAFLNGELSDWEGSHGVRELQDGDCVGLWLKVGSEVEVFVNGRAWGKLPECADLGGKGCFAAVVGYESGSNVSFNIGQSAFAHPNPGGPALSWAEVAGVQTFDAGKAVMDIHVHDDTAWSGAYKEGERADNMVLGLVLLDMLARNTSSLPATSSVSSEQTFESSHPYGHGVNHKEKIEIPGALSLNITFDPQCFSEEGCDYLVFAKDEQMSDMYGQQRTGPRWAGLEVEGDTVWYQWHTDGSCNYWGYRFTVKAEMKSSNIPLCIQPDAVTINSITQLIQKPRSTFPPVAFEKLLDLLGSNLSRATNLSDAMRKSAGASLLELAKEKSHLGTKAAAAFGDCCATMFTSPSSLIHAQLEIWEEPGAYHPDAVSIVSEKISTSKNPFGQLVDDPAAGKILSQFADVVTSFEADDAGGEKAARLLWRVLCDCVSHLIGQRAKEPRAGWAAVLGACQKILDSAVKTLTSGPGSLPKYHQVLTLPILHGVASIPSFKGAPWESVVGMLPPLGTLIQRASKAKLPVELVGAALTLTATLGRELVRLGSVQEGEEDGIVEILRLKLMSGVPRSVLGDEYGGPPAGVAMVEKSTAMVLNKEVVDQHAEEAQAGFNELIEGSSERAVAAIKYLETAAKGAMRAMLPARIRRLLFCILVKQQAPLQSVKLLLDTVGNGQEPDYPVLPKLWLQASRLDPFLLSVKQRQAAAGKVGSAVTELMERSLEVLVACEPIDPDAVREAVEDDGLAALWEQQLMDLQPTVDVSKTKSFPSLNSDIVAVEPGQRLQYLLKQIPQPGSTEAKTSAMELKHFFEAPWFGKADPLKMLLMGLQKTSIAAWRRAAGLSLLAWAAQECATGAEPWVTGFVLSTLSEAWQQEAAIQECCAETPALIALAAARQHTMLSIGKLCTAASDGRPEGTALQVMSLAAFGGPWRPSDQNMILQVNVLELLKPYFPWSVEVQSTSSEALQSSRAAWLALRSLVALTKGSETEKTTPYGKAVLTLLMGALQKMPAPPADKPIQLSLSNIFGLDTARVEDLVKKTPPLEIFLTDIKTRLEAKEDFGGLENDTDAYNAWLAKLPSFLERFMKNESRRTLIEELQDDEGVEWDDNVCWSDHDKSGDGYLDLYEALALFVAMRSDPEQAHLLDSLKEFPEKLPDGLPRFFGDKEPKPEKKPLLATLPVSSSIAAPRCALFRCMDGFLRAQPGLDITSGAKEADAEDAKNTLKALLQVAADPKEPVMEAVLSLQILRLMAKMPGAKFESVASTLLKVIAEPGNTSLLLTAQRARVLRDCFLQDGSFATVQKTVMAALQAEDAAQSLAALRVLADAPVLQALATGNAGAAGSCTVIEDVSTFALRPATLTMHDGRCANGSCESACMTVAEAKAKMIADPKILGLQIQKCHLEKGEEPVNIYFQSGSKNMAENSEYVFFTREEPPPGSALVLRHSAGLTESVLSSTLQLQVEQCDVSKFSQEDRTRIVDVALTAKKQYAWALRAVLSQADAAGHFVKSGGLSTWLPLAIQTTSPWIGMFTPKQRSSISAMLRAEFPDAMDSVGEDPPSPPAPPADADPDEASEEAGIDSAVLKRAARALNLGDWPNKEAALDMSQICIAARDILKSTPERKIARVYALQGPEEAEAEVASKEAFGLVESVDAASGGSSGPSNGPDHNAVHSCLVDARSSPEQLASLAEEAVSWDRQTLALEVCLAVALHAGSSPAGSQIDLSSAPPEQFAQLCLSFERALASDDLKKTARSAMLAVVAGSMPILSAVQELALAHLFGSLGCTKGGSSKSGNSYESSHPYGNYEDTSETVSVPGAKRVRIKFDPRCRTEENCDNLVFTWGDESKTVTGCNRIVWEDFVINAAEFTFTWHSDSSSTDWGYKFTVVPEGGDKKAGPKVMPSFSDGLWLLDFLLDVLPALEGKGADFGAEKLLRPELVSTLFAHVERDSDEASVGVLSRFVEACGMRQIGYDWTNARHALSAMTVAAQDRKDQSRVQQCAALRLSLPGVKVPTEQPRFSSSNGASVQLLHKDTIAVSKVPRDTFCCVNTAAKAVLFRQMADQGSAEAWVGAVRTSAAGVVSQTVCLLRLSDGATFTDALDTSDPISTDLLKEVRVIINESKNELTFDGQGLFRKLKLPLSAAEGRWCLAAKLCGFGASVGVFPPSLSDKGLLDLRAAWDTAKALMSGAAIEQWPADFVAETFNEWWSATSGDKAENQGSQAESKYSSLTSGNILVEGAGIEKYNGTYSVMTNHGRCDKPEYANDNGCKIFYEDLGIPGLAGWCLNEGECNPPSAYAASLVDTKTGDPVGPWFAVTEEAGKPPTVYNPDGKETIAKLADFSPARVSSRSSPAFEVSAISVQVVDGMTVVLLKMTNENCEPFLLCAEKDEEPKRVSSSEFRCWGTAGCIFAPNSEWTTGAQPSLHLSGGEGFEVIHLCGWKDPAKKDKMKGMSTKLAKVFESPHPLPTDQRTTLKVTLPKALGLTLQFSRESQLPEGTVALVTLDEAGEKPAALIRRGGSTDVALPVNRSKMRQDAARGIIEMVQGQAFKLDGAAECFIHLPTSRPIDWDRLPALPPQPVKVESPHSYKPNSNVKEQVVFKGAVRMKVTFSTSCYTESGYDKLSFYRDESLSEHLITYQGSGPWADFEIEGDNFWYTFISDGGGEYWGYEFLVTNVGELSDDAFSGPLPVDDSVPTLFEEGVQLGAAGTLLFKGGSSADWQAVPAVTALEVPITNEYEHESFMYATLDNAAPSSDDEKGTQPDWIAMPKGWNLAPMTESVNSEVIAAFSWATDSLVLADGSAIGTSSCKPGEIIKSDKLQKARCQENREAYRPGFALARVLIRRKAAPPAPEDGGEGAAEAPAEAPAEGAEAETEGKEEEPGYVVRQSRAALNWLRPGLLAGEVSVDFSGAPLAAGDIAVGITVGTQRSLLWPAPSEAPEEAKEEEKAPAAEEAKEGEKAEGEAAEEAATPRPEAAAGGEPTELLIMVPCKSELSGTYKKVEEGKWAKEGDSDADLKFEDDWWKLRYSGSIYLGQAKPEGGGIPFGEWKRENNFSFHIDYAGVQIVAPLRCAGPRRYAPKFDGCWVGESDGLRKATIMDGYVRWHDGSSSKVQYKDHETIATTSSDGKFVNGTLSGTGRLNWSDGSIWVRSEAYPFKNGDKVMLTTKYASYADGGSGPLHVGFQGSICSTNRGAQQPWDVRAGGTWWYEWSCLTRWIDEQTEGWVAIGIAEGQFEGGMSSSTQLEEEGGQIRSAAKARLDQKGFWAPATDNQDTCKAWLQIDFGRTREVTGVATQGCGPEGDTDSWTTRYEVHASDDANKWKTLKNETGDVLFLGNGDRDTILRHAFLWPVKARYLRFLPKEWNGKAAMRVEAYTFQDPPQAWWWRCDGAAFAWDSGAKPKDAAATFGAGDVVGVMVSVEDNFLRRLEFLRNGRGVAAIDLPAGSNPLPEDEASGCKLALSVGLRRSSTCVSLQPAPKVLEQLPTGGAEVSPLEANEEAMAKGVFKAIDVSGDGTLDRKEFAAVLGGVRDELFEASDQGKDSKISESEWIQYCMLVKTGNGPIGLALFLDSFRKKLLHIGRVVTFQDAATEKKGAWGVRVTAKPNGFTTEGMLEAARDVVPDEWAKFQQLAVSGWEGHLSESHVGVVAWLETSANGVGKDAFKWDLPQFRSALKTLKSERAKAFPTFTESDERLAARFVVIRQLNSWIRDRLLPYVDLAAILKTPFGRTMSEARGLLFGKWRTEQFNRIIEDTFTNDESSLQLNRNLQTEIRSANECDVAGTKMLFAQSSYKVEEEHAFGINVFRSRGPSYNRPINISYVDESGIDQGGLYRDWLDEMATELMSTNLPLFMQTPNGRNNAGEDRQAWLLNPTPLTNASRRMLHFLGKMMGVCIRRGDVIPMSLSRMTWKLFVNDAPTVQDLALTDVAAAESVKQLMDVSQLGVGPDDFEFVFGDIRFVYHNSAGEEVPLVDGGADIKVTFENARQFGEAVLAMRSNEAREHVECVRAGMACVVPISCFSLWSWRDLEIKVCGDPFIDVAVMKKHTIYEGLEEDRDCVKFMWKALEQFAQEDLQRFIRFVWGRSRLPADGSTQWGNGFKCAGASDIPPDGLPRAHTCFFQIDLPYYRSVQEAHEKILFAVRNCVSLLIA